MISTFLYGNYNKWYRKYWSLVFEDPHDVFLIGKVTVVINVFWAGGTINILIRQHFLHKNVRLRFQYAKLILHTMLKE